MHCVCVCDASKKYFNCLVPPPDNSVTKLREKFNRIYAQEVTYSGSRKRIGAVCINAASAKGRQIAWRSITCKECRSEKPWQGENAVIKAVSSLIPCHRLSALIPASHCPLLLHSTAISIKASVYCKLVRESEAPPARRRESLSWYGKAINFNGLWKPNYLLHVPSPSAAPSPSPLARTHSPSSRYASR